MQNVNSNLQNQSVLGPLIDGIDRLNNRINVTCDHFSYQQAIPGIKATYNKVGEVVCGATGLLSKNLQASVNEFWFDPFSTRIVLKISKVVESIALWHAVKKPISKQSFLPGYFHYLSTSIISSAQHLHNFIKEVNFLLKLPSTLRYYSTAPSFDRFVNKLPNFFGRSWVVVSKVIIGSKYLLLSLIKSILLVVELTFNILNLDGLFFLIKSLREVIDASIGKASEKMTKVAHDVITKRENAVRKALTVVIVNASTEFFVPIVNRALAKSFLGGAAFFGVKTVLQATTSLSSMPIYLAGVSTLIPILWKSVVRPNLDPYYDSYISNFNPESSRLWNFCHQYKLAYLYPSLKTIQIYSQTKYPEVKAPNFKL